MVKLFKKEGRRYAEAEDAEIITVAVRLLHDVGLTKASEFITHELVRVALMPRYVSQKEGGRFTGKLSMPQEAKAIPTPPGVDSLYPEPKLPKHMKEKKE
jgi:hypothetical protein